MKVTINIHIANPDSVEVLDEQNTTEENPDPVMVPPTGNTAMLEHGDGDSTPRTLGFCADDRAGE